MRTEKTNTAYWMKHGGKHQCVACSVCGRIVHANGATFRIRGEKIGLYCSPQCIDAEILNRQK